MRKILLALVLIALISPTVNASEPDIDLCMEVPEQGMSDINGWGWKPEYGVYEVDNYRWDYLTVWYDPFQEHYTLDHPYSSLSDEHIPNGAEVYPINEMYTNEYGNTFIAFVFTDLKHPEYTADGDGIYWLLYENKNGTQFLTQKEPSQ